MNTSQVSPALRSQLPGLVTSTVTPSTAMQNQGIATNQNSIGGSPSALRAITGVEQHKHKKKQKDISINDDGDNYGSENVKQVLNDKVVVVRMSKRLQKKENIDNNQAWKKEDKKVVKSSRSSKKTKSSTNTATKKIKKVKGSDVKVSAKPVRRSRRLKGLAAVEDDVEVVNNVQDVVAISTRVEEVVDKRESTTNNNVNVKVQEVVDEVKEVQPPIEDITSSNDDNVVEMVTPVVDDTGMNVQKEVEDWYSTRYGILDDTIKQHNEEKDDDDTLPVEEEQSNTVVVETVDVNPPVQVTSTKRARLEYVLSSESPDVEPWNQKKRRKIENAETESADVQPPVQANNTSATSSRPPKRIRPEYVLSSETTDEEPCNQQKRRKIEKNTAVEETVDVQPPVQVTSTKRIRPEYVLSSGSNDEEPKKKRHKIEKNTAVEDTVDVQPPVQTTSTNNTSVELNKSAAVEDDVLPQDQADNVESDAPKKKKITVLYSPELGFYYLLPLEEGGDPNQVQLVHYDAHGVFPFFVSPRPKGEQPAVFVAAQGQRTADWDECADIPEEYEAESDDDTDKDREKKIIKRRLYARAKKSRINELADNLALSIIHRYNLKKLPTAELEWLYLLCYSRYWKSRDGPTAAYLEAFHDACVAWEKGQGKVFKFWDRCPRHKFNHPSIHPSIHPTRSLATELECPYVYTGVLLRSYTSSLNLLH